jgi:hypothetical protein
MLLDGDQTLEFDRSNLAAIKPNLTSGDVVSIFQISECMDWKNVRLVRADKDQIRYVRRTHEYLDPGRAPVTRSDAAGFLVREHSDGGNRSEKLARDERLLTLDLKDNPRDERSMFYLARTLKDMGRKDEAVKWFRKRIDTGGYFSEETWIAQLYLGRLYREINADEKIAKRELWKAFEARPWRREPLLNIATIAMNKLSHAEAVVIANMAMSIPYPKQDILFIERPLYDDWAFLRIVAICAYYTKDMAMGLKACERLRFSPGSPCKNESPSYTRWYVKPLDCEWHREIKTVLIENGFFPCNPSIIRRPRTMEVHQYFVCLRTVNYQINNDGSYRYSESNGKQMAETKNYLMEIDVGNEENRVTREVELKCPPSVNNSPIIGCEDVRLYWTDGSIVRGVGTRLDVNPKSKSPSPYHLGWDAKSGECVRQEEMSGTGLCEKNWMPIAMDDPYGTYCLELVYSHDPCVIKRFSVNNASLEYLEDDCNPNDRTIDLSGLRGSTCLIPWTHNGMDGHLGVVHENTHESGRKRHYYSRFVFYGHRRPFIISRPWILQHRGIEFVSGLAAFGHDKVLITYGIEDHSAHMSCVTNRAVSDLLCSDDAIKVGEALGSSAS